MTTAEVELPFGRKILQSSSGHGITSDTSNLVAKILADNPNKPLSLLDLGSGNGIIAIMLKYYRPLWRCTGMEIQEHLVIMARENAVRAGVEVEFNLNDLRKSNPVGNTCDIIVSNPPYFARHQGRISPHRERAVSRHEICCSMKDVLICCSRNLKTQGRIYLVYPDTRMAELQKITKKIDLKILEKIILADKLRKNIVVISK